MIFWEKICQNHEKADRKKIKKYVTKKMYSLRNENVRVVMQVYLEKSALKRSTLDLIYSNSLVF